MHPYVIYKLIYFYDSLAGATCKLFEFLIHAGLSVQILVLLSVSIDRYTSSYSCQLRLLLSQGLSEFL